MSSIVSSVLNVTFGLLWNKLRDHTAEKLKEGDVTDEKFRKLIVRELDDIKSKLDGLVRKDLLSSVEFLKEGISGLRMCLDGLTDDRNSSKAEPVLNKGLPLASLNLSEAMTRLKITSEDRFKLAKKSFRAAREEATRAFSNEALSTEDRIFATKLRITSSIMENLDDLEFAATNAKLYLERLHDLPAIKEAFSVHLDGGMKSLFNKSKRLEIVQSVTMIDMVLYDFTGRFTKIPQDLFDWPKIELGKRTYQPLLNRDESISLGEFGVATQGPFQLKYGEGVKIYAWCSAVNSKGEIIAKSGRDVVSVVNREGKSRIFCSLPSEGTVFEIQALAVDEDDNVYIVSRCKVIDPDDDMTIYKRTATLFVFDSNGNIKHQCSLDFLPGYNVFPRIVINKEKMIAIRMWDFCAFVYICDSNGQLKAKCDLEVKLRVLCWSDTNEIIVAPRRGETVYVRTEEGKLKRKIELPRNYLTLGVAFNYITKNIVVLAEHKTSETWHLLNYSETDEPQCLSLGSFRYWEVSISSHPNGPVAVIHERLGVTYIYL